jgi:serine/threonine-protein kinase
VSEDNIQSPVGEGDVIAGKYRVERVLGVGGMGVVVAARHVELGELFALKFLLPGIRDRDAVAKRFAREARTGIRVKNEHVARVFDVGTLPDGAPYMVMEHLSGEDLASVIERRGVLPVAEAVDLLLQACEALCEAHQLGIVHRDLKPANLFITAGSDGLPFVKVLDFGISKVVTGSEDVSVTVSASILGTPLYMSPEQLTASKDIDHRSDIWSLGVILYEVLTGATPFASPSVAALGAAVLGGKYPPPSEIRPELPVEIDRLIASILTTDRAQRLGSIELLANRLVPFGTAAAKMSRDRIRRIAARPPALRAKETGPARANPDLETTEVRAERAADEAQLASVEIDLGDIRRSEPTASKPSAKQAGSRGWLVVGAALAGAALVAVVVAVVARSPERPGATTGSVSSVPVVLANETPVVPTSDPVIVAAAPAASSSVPAVASVRDPAPAPSSRPAKPEGGSKAEGLTRAFARREADVSRCFDTNAVDLSGDPKLSIRFTVDVDGHVKAAQVFPPELAPTSLGQCLANVARGTEFGKQAEETTFRIPIVARRGS